MKKVIGFYRKFFQTLNIASYAEFSESTTKNSFNYYLHLVTNMFVIMMICMIPALVQLPNELNQKFNNIETFKFNIDFKTSNPLTFPEKNPFLLISYNNQTPSQGANIILNNNMLYFGALFKTYETNLTKYKDVKAESSGFSNIFAVILILMAPTLALLGYFYRLIKYLPIIFIASILAMIIAFVLRYKVSYKKMFNCAMYGSSLTVLLDMLFFAFGFEFYYIQYLPLLIFVIVGVVENGDKIDPKMKNKYVEVKGY